MSIKSLSHSSFTEKILISVSVFIIALAGLYMFRYAIEVVLVVFAGILFSVFLRSLTNWLKARVSMPDKVALSIVIAILLGLTTAFFLLAAPSISEQVSKLSEEIPKAVSQLKTEIKKYSLGEMGLSFINNNNISKIVEQNGMSVNKVAGFFSSTFGILANLLIIIFIGLYMAIEPRVYKSGLIALFPLKQRSRVKNILKLLYCTIQSWLIGRITSMLIIGIFTTIGLWALNIPLAFTLGIIAMFLTFIPNIGPIISVIPAALLGLMESPQKAVYVLILYAGIQAIESYILTPIIQRKEVSLPPVMTITAQVLLGLLVGGLGLILATPLMAILLVLVQVLYVKGILGDDHFENKLKKKFNLETDI